MNLYYENTLGDDYILVYDSDTGEMLANLSPVKGGFVLVSGLKAVEEISKELLSANTIQDAISLMYDRIEMDENADYILRKQ